jgi:hypothetical protein
MLVPETHFFLLCFGLVGAQIQRITNQPHQNSKIQPMMVEHSNRSSGSQVDHIYGTFLHTTSVVQCILLFLHEVTELENHCTP